ncbi:hypothetical protein BDV93DRAFT_406550, partial [Ceratobasidium sp. AG-I]
GYRVSDREAVQHIKGFLKGRAAVFYMNHVAPEISKYTLTKLFQDVFEYCFPLDVKAHLRKKFQGMVQTDRGFKDCVWEMKKLQRQLTDISDKQVALRMWDGAHRYLR